MTAFPFSAIVGQDDLKLGLLLACTDPSIGGVLALGDRGTGKSTTVRALAGLLPPMAVNQGCRFNCNPAHPDDWCDECRASGIPAVIHCRVPVVDLPLGATEDRIVGALDIERALAHGQKSLEPGLLARANRGFLYVDEVNLLEDHLVDLLIDVAASGENIIERDGLSLRHSARFVLIGSGNPEEGELRPQLLDRFGLSVEVRTPLDIPTRMEVVRRRDSFDRDPKAFAQSWQAEDDALADRIEAAKRALYAVEMPQPVLEHASRLCVALGTDGLRGELTLLRAGRALAAFEGRSEAVLEDIRRLAPSALRHRLRRDPLDETGSTARIERAMHEVFAQ